MTDELKTKSGTYPTKIKDELKTLKDIEEEIIHRFPLAERAIRYVFKRLRQEAIKWVKQFNNREDNQTKVFILTFFNLTEEDLK